MAHGGIIGQQPAQTAQDTKYNNQSTSSIITSDNVQGAIDQLFTSVSNGKNKIASAITGKGVSTSGTDSFDVMAGNIKKIKSASSKSVTFNFNNSVLIPNDFSRSKWLTIASSVSSYSRAKVYWNEGLTQAYNFTPSGNWATGGTLIIGQGDTLTFEYGYRDAIEMRMAYGGLQLRFQAGTDDRTSDWGVGSLTATFIND